MGDMVRGIRGILLVVGAAALITAGWAGASWMNRRDKVTKSDPESVVRMSRARAEVAIEGMDCMMCAAGLQAKLRALPGVSSAEVSYQDSRATVEFDTAVIDRSRIIEAIQKDGLKVTR